jgi:hypothetical protein
MRSLFLLFLALFFIGCSPKYKITKEYIPPNSVVQSTSITACQIEKERCKSRCKEAFEICEPKAKELAKKRYDKKLRDYKVAIREYERLMQEIEFQRDMALFDRGFYGYYGDPFFCNPYYGFRNRLLFYEPFPPTYYLLKKPRKPSLEAEILKAESEICKLDCRCEEKYDDCFIASGGTIKQKRVCVENCD